MNFTSDLRDTELYILQDENVFNTHSNHKLINYTKEFKKPVIHIDLKNVKCAGSALVNTLAAIRNITQSKIFIHHANEEILILLEIVGLHHIFNIVGNDEYKNKSETVYYLS